MQQGTSLFIIAASNLEGFHGYHMQTLYSGCIPKCMHINVNENIHVHSVYTHVHTHTYALTYTHTNMHNSLGVLHYWIFFTFLHLHWIRLILLTSYPRLLFNHDHGNVVISIAKLNMIITRKVITTCLILWSRFNDNDEYDHNYGLIIKVITIIMTMITIIWWFWRIW